jgi:hypothetical protein
LEKIIQQPNNPENLEEELANVIAILNGQQPKEGTTTHSRSLDRMDLSPWTWTKMFGFVPRPQLAELVPQIGNWHFASKAQYYLHEYGRISLGYLRIRKSNSWINRKNGIPIVKLYEKGQYKPYKPWEYPLADAPISKNIIHFRCIHIRLAL